MKGFALVYVLLLIALISATVIAVSSSSTIDIKMVRKISDTAKSRQIAQSGLEYGISYWKNIFEEITSCSDVKFKMYPSEADDKNGYADVKICPDSITSVGNFDQGKSAMKAEADPASGMITKIYKTGI